eukprot:m.6087 g.6087  ORF g.6087 m.6087 type:complete len:162 (+) comp8216_c0_seq1:64-549(+)
MPSTFIPGLDNRSPYVLSFCLLALPLPLYSQAFEPVESTLRLLREGAMRQYEPPAQVAAAAPCFMCRNVSVSSCSHCHRVACPACSSGCHLCQQAACKQCLTPVYTPSHQLELCSSCCQSVSEAGTVIDLPSINHPSLLETDDPMGADPQQPRIDMFLKRS